MAEEMGHDEAWQQEQVEAFRSVAEGYLMEELAETEMA
jgi:hypothetical protein